MYNLKVVPQIFFGSGSVAAVGRVVAADARVLIVSGNSAERSGTVERVKKLLAPRAVEVFAGVEAEPSIQQVDQIREFARSFGCSAVVAIGGGSAMDVGKAVAAAGSSTVPTAEFFYDRSELPAAGCFMAAVPTTAGTGAEVTPNGVFTDKTSNIKQSIRGGSILPQAALVDPELTLSCPAQVTINSGMDALTQGIESYISRNSSNASRALAMQGVKLIVGALEKVVDDPGNINLRSDMSEGTMLGAIAFASSGLGAVHGLAHPLGARLHLPHGRVCGMLLAEVLKWNMSVCADALDELAAFAGWQNGKELIRQVEALQKHFGLESRLSACGLQESDLEWVVKNSRSGSMRANPRDFSDAELTALLQEML